MVVSYYICTMGRWNNIKPIDVDFAVSNYGKMPMHEIAKTLNATTDRIRRVLKMHGVATIGKSEMYKNINMFRFSYEDEFCNDYINGMNKKELCIKYRIGHDKAKFLIARNNIYKNETRSDSVKKAWETGRRQPRNCNKGGTENIHNALFGRWKTNAKSRNYPFTVSIDYLQEILEQQNYKCAYSNISMLCPSTYIEKREMTSSPFLISLDRIDNELGYVKDNVHFVCVWINKARGSYSHETFKQLINSLKSQV